MINSLSQVVSWSLLIAQYINEGMIKQIDKELIDLQDMIYQIKIVLNPFSIR
jgi:hypothetical protein